MMEELFGFMEQEHNLCLTDGQLHDLIAAVVRHLEANGKVIADEKELRRHLEGYETYQELHRCHLISVDGEDLSFRAVPRRERVRRMMSSLTGKCVQHREEDSDG